MNKRDELNFEESKDEKYFTKEKFFLKNGISEKEFEKIEKLNFKWDKKYEEQATIAAFIWFMSFIFLIAVSGMNTGRVEILGEGALTLMQKLPVIISGSISLISFFTMGFFIEKRKEYRLKQLKE